MRVMAYTASLLAGLALLGGFLWWRRKLLKAKWFWGLAVIGGFTPYIINTAGWMLTENGRQPWIVQGLMLTEDGVSPSVSATEIIISMVAFGLVYLILGVVWATLMVRTAKKGLPDESDDAESDDPDRAPALTY